MTMPTEHVIVYFGEKWDVPMLDEGDGVRIEQAPLPIHLRCSNCGDNFFDGDRGLLRPVLDFDENGRPEASAGAVHAECDLRAMIGHTLQVCDCFLPTLSWHEQGRRAWAKVNEQRRAGGRGPL